MKKSILYSLILIAFVACGGGGDADGENPQVNKDKLIVPTSLEFLSDAQTTEMAINANCSWTISKDVDWLTVNPMSGANNQTVIISVTKNTTNADRMAILTVQGGSLPAKRVTVTQRKATDTPVQYSLNVDKNSLEFEKDGGNQSFVITSNTNWTITCPDWCTLSKKSGNGNATITVTATKNDKAEQRSGQIVISGDGVNDVKVNVTQKPADDTPIQYSLTVNKNSLEFEKDGGNQSFVITSNTSWTITCPDWCTLSKKSGNGNATITVTATKNDKTEQRSGQIVISGDGVNDVNITITQEPADEIPNGPDPGDNLPPS